MVAHQPVLRTVPHAAADAALRHAASRALSKPVSHYATGKLAAVVWPWALWMVGYGVLVHHAGPGNPDYWLTGAATCGSWAC